MKLSDLLALPDDACEPFYAGVDVDVESFTPPAGLKEIGLLYKGDAGDIDTVLMDVVIAYRLADVEVVLEIPAEADGVDARYLLAVAANANFSLTLLPPAEETDEARAAYKERLGVFAEAFFSQPNFAKFVYPISSFLEYMFVEVLADAEGYAARDPYIRLRFLDVVSPAFEAEFKADLKERIHAIFGGAEGFADFARAMAWKIYKQVETNAKELAAQDERTQGGDAGDGDAQA